MTAPHSDAYELASFRATVLDGAISAVITSDQGVIIDWNKAAERMFLYAREEVVGRPLSDLLVPGSDVTVLDAASYGEGDFVHEQRMLTKAGRTIDVEIGVRNFPSDSRVVAFIRDISRRVEAERGRRRVLERLLEAETELRAQIAEELHDDTIQVIAATLLKLDTCELRIAELSAACGDSAKAALEDYTVMLVSAIWTLRQALHRTRRMMFELRPPALKHSGLEIAVANLAQQIDLEVQTKSEVEIDVKRYSAAIEELAYRVVLESLTNIRKHAKARRVEIKLSESEGSLVGIISDDGQGFDVQRVMSREERHLHMGVDSCAERMQLAGGHYFIVSQPGNGTTVSFDIPIGGMPSWESLYRVVG